MKPRRRRTTSPHSDGATGSSVMQSDDGASARRSRTEAAIDVPREDDLATTSSTHTSLLERRNEEPSDGQVPEVLDAT